MLGTPRLLTFVFRALVLLLIMVIAWFSLAEHYNQALAAVAGPLLPDDAIVWELGTQLIYEHPVFSDKVAIDGLTLHFGLVLVSVVVLAAVGIGVMPRLTWLAAMVAGSFLVHVAGVALLGRGLVWAGGTDSPDSSVRLVLSLFAVYWGLLPPVVGGLWCFAYWLPRVRGADAARATSNQNLTTS